MFGLERRFTRLSSPGDRRRVGWEKGFAGDGFIGGIHRSHHKADDATGQDKGRYDDKDLAELAGAFFAGWLNGFGPGPGGFG